MKKEDDKNEDALTPDANVFLRARKLFHASKRTRWRSVCPVLRKGISGFFLWWSLSLGSKQLNELWESGDTEKHSNNSFDRPHTHGR